MTKLDRFLTPNEQKEVEKDIPIWLRDYYEGLEHPRLYIVESGSYTAKKLLDAYQATFFEIKIMMNRGRAWEDNKNIWGAKNIMYIIVDDDTVGDDPEDILDYVIRFKKLDRFLTPNEQKEVEKDIPIWLRDYYEGLEHPRLYIVESGSYTAKKLDVYQPPLKFESPLPPFEIMIMNEGISWVDKNIKYKEHIFWVDKNIKYIIVDDDTVGDDPEDILDYMIHLTKLDRFLTPNEQKEVEKDIPIRLRDYYEGLEHPRLYIAEAGSYTAKELEQPPFIELMFELMFENIYWVDEEITYIIVDDDTVGDDPEDILDYMIRFKKLDRFLTPNEQKEVEKDIPISLRDYYEGLEHPRLYILEKGSYTAEKLEVYQPGFEIELMNKGIAWGDKNITYIIVDDDTVGDDPEPEDLLDYMIRSTKLDRFLTPNEQKEVEKDIPIWLKDYYEGLEHPRLYIVEEGSYTAKKLDRYESDLDYYEQELARYTEFDPCLSPGEIYLVDRTIDKGIIAWGNNKNRMKEGISWGDENIMYIIVDDDTVGDDPQDILDYMTR